MRKKMMAGNWKMNKTVAEAIIFAEAIEGKLPLSEEIETVICAPFLQLPALVDWARNQPISIGAQNMHFADNGAFTGEISPVMLKDIGVTHVIIGHSERREYFDDTDELVNLKCHAAHAHDLTPIICVGETLKHREKNQTQYVVQQQVIKALHKLTGDQVACSVLAYEPIWAIGTGKTATTEQANDVIAYIRSVVSDLYQSQVADSIRIQYGGSVKPENIKELMDQPDIDGALVGGASMKPDSFLQLLEG